MHLRRFFALKKRRASKDIWPINEAASQPPENWPGWPGGNKFAFVLSHDVEGPSGLAKCRQLMELERELGFRSSFNFVPEGDYQTPQQLREDMVKNGFEVGVHDLRHDGKLYWTRKIFSENAARINHYLKEWNATGFRSGFMLHELDWLHELNIRYDSSTFDTDPFEPQPQGKQTIFPFWIANPNNGSGYVELPYTMPQDSTLFLVLREQTSEIWKLKLDWVAKHGGMALVNVHPDYLQFPGEPKSSRTFPAERYVELLNYVRTHYVGDYWQATPGRIAAYCADIQKKQTQLNGAKSHFISRATSAKVDPLLKGKKAVILLFSVYPNDARPRREAHALVRQGMDVEIICLRDNDSEAIQEITNGLKVTRVPFNHKRSSRARYYFEYGAFILICAAKLTRRSLRKRYDLVHVHNMPDVLVFSALVPKLLGAKVILDLHDPMPELYTTIFGFPPNHWFVRLLQFSERWSIAFADLVLTPNIAFRNLFAARSGHSDKIQIIMNSPERDIFSPRKYAHTPVPAEPVFRVMFHGTLLDRHGLDTAIKAVAHLRHRIPNLQLDIYGKRTNHVEHIEQLASDLGVKDMVHLRGKKSHREIAEAILATNLGLIPNKRTPFTEINMPTRIFEYLAMNRPVIAPSTIGIQDYFNNDSLLFFEPGDASDLAKQITWVYDHPKETAGFIKRGRSVFSDYLWSKERRRFVTFVSDLFLPKNS
jgi:glycosyltransferase involved in cell wall biosynthesis